MPLEITEITTRPEDAALFLAACATARGFLLEVPGCEEVMVLQCLEEPERFQVQVRWRQLSDHTEVYPQSPQAQKVRGLLLPLVQSRRMLHFNPC